MKEDLISVIVPVYNVSKYLERCLDSIINQTYKNIEILLIDDESTDDSGKLCDVYAKNDKRIKSFHIKNCGASGARNYGIEKCKGKYICFVDSDDYVINDMCEILYKSIIKYNADMSICRVLDCYGNVPSFDNSKVHDVLLTPYMAVEKVMIAEEISVFPVAKLYKRSIFSDNIRFEVGKIAEDAIIMMELIPKCKKIVYNSSIVYYYIHRKNSLTTKKFNPDDGYDVIYAYERNYNIIQKKYPKLLKIARMRLCWAHFTVLDNMVKSDYPVDKKILKYLRRNFLFIICNKHFTKARKFSIVILMFSFKLYSICAKKFYNIERNIYD